MATSLTGQATSSDQSGEASGTVLIGDYPEAMQRAQQLLFEDPMGHTDDLLSEGHMSNLAVQTVNDWMTGSFTAVLVDSERKGSPCSLGRKLSQSSQPTPNWLS